MTKKEEEIQKLTAIWYELVNLDHHKDRDCHFYIQETWSYGNPPVYRLEHNGYIAHDFEGETFGTREEALDGLITFLQEILGNERQWAKGVIAEPKNWDEEQIKNAGKILELTNGIIPSQTKKPTS